ncbi:methylenetetrahydrofolate reductase C-terminal domain-containing protein [Acinetobacter sp. WU_MDCI_Axc73]|nr:methylenetetrahydrofolate reductase C-terminal domain-containing protein [Acinetobacter sp. WU_MDCI_Axc73]
MFLSLKSADSNQTQFSIWVEYLCSNIQYQPAKQAIAGFPAMLTFADRVHSDEDPDPISVAAQFPQEIAKLLHFSGKDRDIRQFEHFLDQAEQLGYRHLLLLSGDKLKKHQDGKEQFTERTRYLESVNAVMAAKKRDKFSIGVAFNPFKYTEAESDAQYFKLHKKIQAGADFLITQLGFDLDKIKQTQTRLINDYPHFPLIACVMPLTFRRARYMLKHQVAGIVLPQHILKILEEEHLKDPVQAKKNVYERCALQILICKHLGYAGIHLSACHQPEEQQQLEQAIKKYQAFTLDDCKEHWNILWRAESESVFQPDVKPLANKVKMAQLIKYRTLDWMHRFFFDSPVAMGVGQFIFKPSFWNRSKANQILLSIEYISKHSLVGCESCGQCRLADTLYICPETCPKGLANGPCGGTTIDRCEFGDRECIHSIKARVAKVVGQTEILKTKLIPTVSIDKRNTSSWKNWYEAECKD